MAQINYMTQAVDPSKLGIFKNMFRAVETSKVRKVRYMIQGTWHSFRVPKDYALRYYEDLGLMACVPADSSVNTIDAGAAIFEVNAIEIQGLDITYKKDDGSPEA